MGALGPGRHSAGRTGRHSASWNDNETAGGTPRRARHSGSRTAWLRQPRSLRMRLSWAAAVATASALAATGVALASGPGSKTAVLAASRTHGTLFGASVSGRVGLRAATKDFGHMPIIRTSFAGLPPANTWTTGPDAINKSAVIVSFAAAPKTVLAGTDDAALSRFFETAPASHRIYYAYYSEPEANVSRHQFSVAQYRRAWLHIVALARKAANPQLTPTLLLRAADVTTGVDWQSYLPGRNVVKTIAWDAYPAGTLTGQNPQLTSPATFMGPAIAAARNAGLKSGFAGFALARQNGRPAWLKAVGQYLTNNGALFGVLSSPSAATQLTDRLSIAAWRAVVATSGKHRRTSPSPKPTASSPAPSSPTPSPTAPSAPTSSAPAPSSP